MTTRALSLSNDRLLEQSASVRGFNLGNYLDRVPDNLANLFQLIAEGKLKPVVDKTEFKGLEAIPDALDYLFARKNVGKLAVKLV
jgi:prostaglandin reductase 3